MSYPPPPQQGQNDAGVARQNDPRNDPRAYQYRPIMPNLRIEPPITQAPTFGQYVRSDTRGTPGVRGPRWAGRIAFWLGLASVVLLWGVAGIFSLTAFFGVAAAFSVVALFFGLVAFVAGIGRALGFWGIVLALAGNIIVIQWLQAAFS
ncbi:MAG TPA: hypothetical protein VGO65_09215 [Pseudolysinimonas sp.]|nr:hypothetical protein [Pseudolysinimonas sp.]